VSVFTSSLCRVRTSGIYQRSLDTLGAQWPQPPVQIDSADWSLVTHSAACAAVSDDGVASTGCVRAAAVNKAVGFQDALPCMVAYALVKPCLSPTPTPSPRSQGLTTDRKSSRSRRWPEAMTWSACWPETTAFAPLRLPQRCDTLVDQRDESSSAVSPRWRQWHRIHDALSLHVLEGSANLSSLRYVEDAFREARRWKTSEVQHAELVRCTRSPIHVIAP